MREACGHPLVQLRHVLQAEGAGDCPALAPDRRLDAVAAQPAQVRMPRKVFLSRLLHRMSGSVRVADSCPGAAAPGAEPAAASSCFNASTVVRPSCRIDAMSTALAPALRACAR